MPGFNPSVAIFPKGHLFGLTLANNGSDATNDIDFAAGQCVDSTGAAFWASSALTKRLDATFVAGNNAGGLDTGVASNTTYHCFAIRKDSDGSGDFLFSLSATAPTMPTGYTYFRRIGSILRESGAIVAFVQNGDRFLRSVPIRSVATSAPGTSAVLATMAVPSGVRVLANLAVMVRDDTPSGDFHVLLTSPDQADTAAAGTVFTLRFAYPGSASVPQAESVMADVMTNTGAQIRYRMEASDADKTIWIVVHGWIDTRGRLA